MREYYKSKKSFLSLAQLALCCNTLAGWTTMIEPGTKSDFIYDLDMRGVEGGVGCE